MVVSEPARPTPHPGALTWLDEQAALDLAISVLSLGEIARGVARMAEGRRKAVLAQWLESSLPAHFEGRVLAVDETVALAWGELTAEGDRTGRPLHVVDGLLLATAKVHELVVVTRNQNDFDGRGVAVLNPYV
jgi:hypothetical protein